MDDLISRQAAIEYFMTNTNWHDEDGYSIDDAEEKRKLLTDYFNGVPSVQTCDDAISRQAAIETTWEEPSFTDPINVLTEIRDRLKALPSVQPEAKQNANGDWVMLNKRKILQAGYEGREIDFYIGGRKFAVREKAQ